MGVTSGELRTRKGLPDGTTLHEYRVPYDSGRLPYPLAVFPYVVAEARYDDRLPVSIYSSAQDAGYAKEKLKVVTEKILPFLEELMGPFPYPCVRIVEVFPTEGNTGLAAKGLVMLSQRIWFAAPISERYDSEPAGVLVDELAHQWNYYKVMLPNFLAEGVSEYTSALFVERHAGRGSLEKRMADFRRGYADLAAFLNLLKKAKADGLTVEQAAKRFALSVEDVAPLWPYADHGELPVTDGRVFPSLYFIKGALAIHALRKHLGDEIFFRGFKRLFAKPSKTELSLLDYRRCFESAYARPLKTFFKRWYYGVGLPE
jgi:aminopeptidase N